MTAQGLQPWALINIKIHSKCALSFQNECSSFCFHLLVAQRTEAAFADEDSEETLAKQKNQVGGKNSKVHK